jgi:hypothetical protein
MSVIEEIYDLLEDFEMYFSLEDMEILKNLLMHHKPGLVLEVICDQLHDHRSQLNEQKIHKLRELCIKMNLPPESTWENLIFMDRVTNEPRRLFRSEDMGREFDETINAITDEVQDKLGSDQVELIREYLKYDEPELAVDTLFGNLLVEKIPVSRQSYEKIQWLLADLKSDKKSLYQGFVLKDLEGT